MEQAKDGTTKPSFSSGLTIIEKAQEIRWTLRLGVAVMFADLLLVWKTGSGITDWSASADQLLANSGSLIAGLLAFSVLISIILPIVGEIFRRLVWELI